MKSTNLRQTATLKNLRKFPPAGDIIKNIIILNLKTYKEGFGRNALKLAKICEKVSFEYDREIAVAVNNAEIYKLASTVEIPIFAQHTDDVGLGGFTGFLPPEIIKEAGAKGTLINHAEHRLKLSEIESLVKRVKNLGLKSCVCTNNIPTTGAAATLEPDYVAVEPPELIGGDISVSNAKPEIIKGSVDAVKKIAPDVALLTGAGIKNGEDVKKAIQLGSSGVLLASGVVKAKDAEKVLIDLARAL